MRLDWHHTPFLIICITSHLHQQIIFNFHNLLLLLFLYLLPLAFLIFLALYPLLHVHIIHIHLFLLLHIFLPHLHIQRLLNSFIFLLNQILPSLLLSLLLLLPLKLIVGNSSLNLLIMLVLVTYDLVSHFWHELGNSLLTLSLVLKTLLLLELYLFCVEIH